MQQLLLTSPITHILIEHCSADKQSSTFHSQLIDHVVHEERKKSPMVTKFFEEYPGCAVPDMLCRIEHTWSGNAFDMPAVAAMSSEQVAWQVTGKVSGIQIQTTYVTLRHYTSYLPQIWIYPATFRALFN